MKIVKHLGGSEIYILTYQCYLMVSEHLNSHLMSLIGNLISMIHQQALNIAQDQP